MSRFQFLFVLLSSILCTHVATADELSGAALLKVLRAGGNTLVMRHANAPQALPDDNTADKDNVKHERQLDDAGKKDARSIGAAIKQLRIPIAEILSSPTFRARETLKYASLGDPKLVPELDENPQGMTASDAPGSVWLKKKAETPQKAATNVLLVSHFPNIRGAFGEKASKVDAGEILVVHADQKGTASIVGRIKPQDWEQLLAL
jgi:phosphohistidine phosphatase SixA